MTREEAQTLAEELVLRMARESFRRRRMGHEAAAATYVGGVRAHYAVVQAGGELMSNSLVSLAACAIEVLRETMVQTGMTAAELRELHALGKTEVPS